MRKYTIRFRLCDTFSGYREVYVMVHFDYRQLDIVASQIIELELSTCGNGQCQNVCDANDIYIFARENDHS